MNRHGSALHVFLVICGCSCFRRVLAITVGIGCYTHDKPSGVQRAEAMYRRCLTINPEHSYALYNLAVLKEETTKNGDYSEVSLD